MRRMLSLAAGRAGGARCWPRRRRRRRPSTTSSQIRSTASRRALGVNHGDRVTWHNADKVDHQVVADNGSFASPILHAGQSWTTTLNAAGMFRYHDALARGSRHGSRQGRRRRR